MILMLVTVNKRRQEKILTVAGQVPTVPTVADHTLPGWLVTDIYLGEICINRVDNLMWTRTNVGIIGPFSTHNHANKALLDAYTQTEANLADAVAKKHAHNNLSLLEQTTEAFTTALKTNYDAAWTWVSTNAANVINHLASLSNPHQVTKSQVGLGSADNTSDADKPVSIATQAALDDKVGNDTDSFTSVAKAQQIVTLTQAEYDGLTPDANTLYVIV